MMSALDIVKRLLKCSSVFDSIHFEQGCKSAYHQFIIPFPFKGFKGRACMDIVVFGNICNSKGILNRVKEFSYSCF